MDEYRVHVESTINFAADKSQLWISKRNGDDYRYLLETELQWSEPYDSSIARPAVSAEPFGLLIPNELGRVLRDALDARYGKRKPEVSWENHYREVAAQRDHWKALYEAERSNNAEYVRARAADRHGSECDNS